LVAVVDSYCLRPLLYLFSRLHQRCADRELFWVRVGQQSRTVGPVCTCKLQYTGHNGPIICHARCHCQTGAFDVIELYAYIMMLLLSPSNVPSYRKHGYSGAYTLHFVSQHNDTRPILSIFYSCKSVACDILMVLAVKRVHNLTHFLHKNRKVMLSSCQ